MPSLTQQPQMPPPAPASKKRARDDDFSEVQPPLRSLPPNAQTPSWPGWGNSHAAYEPDHRRNLSHHASPNNRRKTLPLPLKKRARGSDLENEAEAEPCPLDNGQTQHAARHHHPSHARPDYSTPPISPSAVEPSSARPTASRTTSSAASLSPCHCCLRKPTKKSDLESYMDCTVCGRRTCDVCTRECPGWPPSWGYQGSGGVQEEPDPGGAGHHRQPSSASFTMHDDVDADQPAAAVAAPKPRQFHSNGSTTEGGGWPATSRHHSIVCRHCCLEIGSDGEVACPGCLAGMKGV